MPLLALLLLCNGSIIVTPEPLREGEADDAADDINKADLTDDEGRPLIPTDEPRLLPTTLVE